MTPQTHSLARARADRWWEWPWFLYLIPVAALAWAADRESVMTVQSTLVYLPAWLLPVALVHLAAYAITRDARRSAQALLPLVAGFFCYTALEQMLGTTDAHLLWLALALFGFFLWRCGPRLAVAANAITFALLLQPAAIVVILLVQSRPLPTDAMQFPPAVRSEAQMPDIYHFLLDAYTRPDVDGELHEGESTRLAATLRSMGFKIIPHGRANYSQTVLSVASLYYAGDLALQSAIVEQRAMPWEEHVPGRAFREALQQSLLDFPAAAAIRDHYRIVQADVGYSYVRLARWPAFPGIAFWDCEFYAREWPIHRSLPIERWCERIDGIPYRFSAPYRMLKSFETPIELAPSKRPTYYFRHVLAPHPPFIIDEQGGFVPHDAPDAFYEGHGTTTAQAGTYSAGYAQKQRWVNTVIVARVDELIRRTSRPLIIIIHGDHGSGEHTGDSVADSCVRERLSPFIAVYASDRALVDRLPDDLDIANVFRYVLPGALGTPVTPVQAQSYFASWAAPTRPTTVSLTQLAIPCTPRKASSGPNVEPGAP